MAVIASHPEYDASIELHAFASPSAPPYRKRTRSESNDLKYNYYIESVDLSHGI